MIHKFGTKSYIVALSGCFSICTFATIDHPHRPGELIIKYVDPSQKSLNLKSLGAIEENLSQESKSVVIKFNQKSISLESMIEQISRHPNVEFVEPNYIYSVGTPKAESYLYRDSISYHAMAPSDPLFGQLWGLENTGSNEPNANTAGTVGADISAYKAWAITKGSRQVKIAVIDTGIDYNHSDLKENLWVNVAEQLGTPGVDDDGNGYVDDIYGYDFANDDGDPLDGHGHGTHCAGTIGAVHDNTLGVAGVMGNVELVAIKFLTDSGSGDTAAAIKAIDYATSLNVDLMSNSWGGGAYSQALEEAIQRASDQGIIFTAAAGNSSSNNDVTPHYPSSYDIPNIISVAAHTATDELASFSCYGKTTVDIAAPGHNILSTYAGGSYSVLSGTSMATPHVSGVLGLLLAEEGRLPHDEMRERLLETSIPVVSYRGKVKRGGRINAYNLLTDERPVRVEPVDGAWKTFDLPTPWETAHPYDINLSERRSYTIPGAKFIRLVIKELDLENFYDYLQISDARGIAVGQISGTLSQTTSDYIEGEEINLLFRSDRSITKWGFVIESLEWQ